MAWGVCQHQAITWNNVNFLLVRFCGIHLGEISQGTILYSEFENYTFKLLPHPTGANELNRVHSRMQTTVFLWENKW